jgi:hypothetical protein
VQSQRHAIFDMAFPSSVIFVQCTRRKKYQARCDFSSRVNSLCDAVISHSSTAGGGLSILPVLPLLYDSIARLLLFFLGNLRSPFFPQRSPSYAEASFIPHPRSRVCDASSESASPAPPAGHCTDSPSSWAGASGRASLLSPSPEHSSLSAYACQLRRQRTFISASGLVWSFRV